MVKRTIDELLSEAGHRRPGPRCKVCLALLALEAKDRAKMSTAIGDRDTYTAVGIARVFHALGQQVSRPSVERHRNGECIGNAA